MSAEDLKATVRRLIEEGWNKGNAAVLDELFAADFVHHSPREPGVKTREQYKQWILDAKAGWPDLRVVLEGMFVGTDHVAAHGTVSSTWQRGDVLGVAPTGKRTTIQWIEIYCFAGGKIVEIWHSRDFYGFLEQVGAIKVPGTNK